MEIKKSVFPKRERTPKEIEKNNQSKMINLKKTQTYTPSTLRNLKRSSKFTSTVMPTVHTKRHENRAFPKRSTNQRNLKTPALRF